MDDLQRWVFALLFSLLIGHLLTDLFVQSLRKPKKNADPEEKNKFESFLESQKPKIIIGVPAWLIGILERFFFTILIGAKVSGAAVAMMTWLLVKMASNWNKIISEEPDARVYGISALAGGMMSMVFALIGGLIYRDSTWWCFTDWRFPLYPKLVQAISIFLTLIGTFLVAFGLKIRGGISDDLRQKLEITKKGLIPPTDVRQHPILIIIGLLLISVAAVFQVWLLFCSP